MNHAQQASPAHISLYASAAEIDKALRKNGTLRDWEYLRDLHFKRSVIPLTVKSLEDVKTVVEKLTLDFNHYQRSPSSGGCQKLHAFKTSLAHKHSAGIDKLDWAISSLARARRVCCGCHETGSFAPREIPAYLLS